MWIWFSQDWTDLIDFVKEIGTCRFLYLESSAQGFPWILITSDNAFREKVWIYLLERGTLGFMFIPIIV